MSGKRWIATGFLWVAWALAEAPPAYAASKTFSGGGDGTLWHDDENWYAEGIPAAADDVTIDKSGVEVSAAEEFAARSVTVGGKASAAWTADPYVYGEIAPVSDSDPALLIRKDGTVVMKGPGAVTLKGSFKNSEETLPTEPSFLIQLE